MIRICSVMAILVCIGGCSHPVDGDLVNKYKSRAGDFEELAEGLQADVASGKLPKEFGFRFVDVSAYIGRAKADYYSGLIAKACAGCDVFRDPVSGGILFLVHANGMPLHGSYKGLASLPSRPEKLYQSFDNEHDPTLDDCKFHFKEITGEWYVYYQSCT